MKPSIMKYYYLSMFLIFIAFACNDNTVEDPSENVISEDYFPLGVGYEWIYQSDSVVLLNGGNNLYESKSQVREYLTEIIDSIDGETTYRMERSVRRDDSKPWVTTDVWTTSTDGTRAYRTEENIRFIKLTFPSIENTIWDGNLFFDDSEEIMVGPDMFNFYLDWSYKIDEVGIMKSIEGENYSDVVHISHVDEDDGFVNRRLSEEFYAPEIGMIEKNVEMFVSLQGKPPGEWIDVADKGFRISYKLLSFSKN